MRSFARNALALVLLGTLAATPAQAGLDPSGLGGLVDAIREGLGGAEEVAPEDVLDLYAQAVDDAGSPVLDETQPATQDIDASVVGVCSQGKMGPLGWSNVCTTPVYQPVLGDPQPQQEPDRAAPAPPAAERPGPAAQAQAHPLLAPEVQPDAAQADAPNAPEPEPAPPARPEPSTVAEETADAPSPRASFLAAVALAGIPLALLAKLAASLLAWLKSKRPSARAKVLAAIAANPGIHHAELVRLVGQGNGTVEHHVLRMRREGLIATDQAFGMTCYYPSGARPADLAHAAALRRASSRRMALALADRPGIALGELARRLGVPPSTAHYQARKLAATGLVAHEEVAGRRRFRLTVQGQALVERVRVPAPAPALA